MRRLSVFLLLLAGAANAGEPVPGVDAHGDPLPAGALARLGTVRLRSGETITGAALSPDGNTVALGNSRGVLQFVAAETGKLEREINVGTSSSNGFHFSPDGKSLVICDYSQIHVWDVGSGQLRVRLQPQQRSYRMASVSFSADGTLMAAGPDGPTQQGQKSRAYVWNLAENKEIGPFEVLQDYQVGAALSADGARLATWGNHINRFGNNRENYGQQIQLWDVKEVKPLRTLVFEGSSSHVQQAAFAPDGRSLAAVSAMASVCIWDTETGKEKLRLAGRRGLSFVRYSPDGKLLLAGTAEGVIMIWDAKSGKRQGVCEGPTRVQSLAFLANGVVRACGSTGQAVLVWEALSGRMLTPASGHTARISSLCFSADARQVVSAGQDGKVLFWDRDTGKEVRHIPIKDDAASRFGSTGRFDLLSLSADSKHLVSSASTFGHTRLWDLATGTVVCDFDGSGGGRPDQLPLAFSSDSSLLAIPDRTGQIRLWDVASGQERMQIKTVQGRNSYGQGKLIFSPDSSLLATCRNYYDNAVPTPVTDIQLFSTATGKELHQLAKLPGTGSAGQGVAFSPDGRSLAHGSMNTIYIFDVASGKKRRELQGVPGMITSLQYSPDGRVLACGVQRNQAIQTVCDVLLFEIATGQVRQQFSGHRGLIDNLAWTFDSQVLASGSVDTTVLLWNATGKNRAATASEPYSAEDLKRFWNDLADVAPARGFQAIGHLLAAPAQAVTFLKENLKANPGKNLTQAELGQLLRDLESDRFVVRERASRKLELAGRLALPVLEKALQLQPQATLELRRRVEGLLEKLDRDEFSGDELRELRGVEILEHLQSTEARNLLQTLAEGSERQLLTQQAQNALQRLR